MLRGLTELLEPVYDVVASADDAPSLLEAVETFSPDVAIIDVSLPNEGEGVVARLQATHPSVRILMVSVYDEDTIVQKAFAAGASGFVLKRRVASDLIPAIQAVLDGEIYRSPELQSPVC